MNITGEITTHEKIGNEGAKMERQIDEFIIYHEKFTNSVL